MRLLLLAQLRFVARAPWSALTAVLGVALAVASIVAVHLIGTAVSRSLDAAWPPHLADLSHLLSRPGLSADDYFRLRDAWRAGSGPWAETAVPAAPALTALVPVIEGYVRIGTQRVRVLGADWLAYGSATEADGRRCRAGRNPPDGRFLHESRSVGASAAGATAGLPAWRLLETDAVMADRALGVAAQAWLPVADARYRVVAVVDSGLGPALFADIATAQRLLGRSADELDFIGAALVDPWTGWRRALDAAMPGIAAGLPQAELSVGELAAGGSGGLLTDLVARPVAAELPATAFARAVLFNVGALGLLALLVAWFLMYQVALIWAERQRPVFDRLHALGVTRGALLAGFVASFALLGLLATVLGLLLGVWLAELLVQVSAAGAGGAPAPGWPDAVLLGKALCSGVGVAVIGGLFAFRGAAAGRPGGRVRPAVRVAVAIPVVLLGAAGAASDRAGLFGGFGAILALALVMLLLVRPVLEGLRAAVLRSAAVAAGRLWVGSLLLRLGMREAVWRPAVVSVALAALALAMATGMGVGLMVESLRADFARMLDARLAGDLYLTGDPQTIAEAHAWLDGQPDELVVRRYGQARIRVGSPGGAGAGSPALLDYGGLDGTESARYGYGGEPRPDEVMVSERLARALAIAPGGAVAIDAVPVRVAHVFAGFGDPEPRVVADAALLDALGIEPVFDRLAVALPRPAVVAGAEPLAARLEAALARQFPALEIVGREAVRARAFAIFDRTFAVTRALTLVALIVAGVGVYNSLTALRLAQAPTRRLLEAQGVLPRELALVTVVRAGTIGGIAACVAAPLGFAMAWVLCAVINPRAFGWSVTLIPEPGGWLPALVLGGVATLLAGLLPAPRERSEFDDAA